MVQKKPKIVAVLVCRVHSRGLFCKPLQEVGGFPILELLINQIKKSKEIHEIVLAISEKDGNEVFVDFAKKYKLKFDLLSDEKLEVIKKYGVWGKKSFMGKEFEGIIRTTFLINSKGKIHKIWSNVRVKDHAKEVFGAARETRTLIGNSHLALNQACLPISAWPHYASE